MKQQIGAAYYPEQNDPGQWAQDLDWMKMGGLNSVRVGEFAWKRFEPSDGKYDFAWLDTFAGMAGQRGIKLLLCSPPKYPNITFELLTAKSPEDLAASGVVPDLVATSNVYVKYMLDLGFGEDLQSMVKTSGTDLGKVEPEALNEPKKFGPKGEICGLPFSMNYGVMLYNKEIFDKLGISYPKDGMTWSQTLELARKATRTDGGVRYIGVSMGALKDSCGNIRCRRRRQAGKVDRHVRRI
ncbi:extracellular solute-binding protein [Paenibacillus sp. GYB003]|uniref:extracellular solute-binding protein n=1 Tax=Paenibacillus sp. GYB003 TaxID=2994392 RepID=UPI002F967679